MNLIAGKLQSLGRKQKILIVLINDFSLALVCWLVFGPAMATFIASEFSNGVLQFLIVEWKSFFFPASLSILYLYSFGFYKSLIKFFDSKDSIFLCVSGASIFGFSWSLIHIYQFQIVSTTFFSIAFLQGSVLAAVFYAFINISRDIAKYFLYPYNTNEDAKPVVIYGAGESGNELFQSILLDRSKRLLAFFDDSKEFKGNWYRSKGVVLKFKILFKKKEY